MITEYVDDELPLPPFEELFGGEEFSPLEKGKRPTKRSTKDGLSGKDESTGRWTPEEHRLFLEGIMLYGKDWKKMQPLIKTRSLVQIRTHAQKVFKQIGQRRGTVAVGVSSLGGQKSSLVTNSTADDNSGAKKKRKTGGAAHEAPQNYRSVGESIGATTSFPAAVTAGGRGTLSAAVLTAPVGTSYHTLKGSGGSTSGGGSSGRSVTAGNFGSFLDVSSTAVRAPISSQYGYYGATTSTRISGGLSGYGVVGAASAGEEERATADAGSGSGATAVSAEDLELLQHMSEQMIEEEVALRRREQQRQ